MEIRTNTEGSKLTSIESDLYSKFVVKNPGMTEEDFLELRKYALGASRSAQKFYLVNNVLMQEKPDLDAKGQLEGKN